MEIDQEILLPDENGLDDFVQDPGAAVQLCLQPGLEGLRLQGGRICWDCLGFCQDFLVFQLL